jgi:predicted AAA+ superfamily ATPase
VDPVVHGRLMDLFRIYMVVGGMPEAVDRYLATNNLRDVMAVQKSITDLYRLDIAKYDPENKLYIRNVFDRIPSELNKKNKRFTVSSVAPNFRLDRDRNTFVWLNDAGVALPVLNIAEPRYPLVASAESSMFKLFLCDVGLLSYMTLDGMQHEVLSGELGMNNGSLFENLVAQELYAHGFVPYYYNSKKLGEVDFMVQNLGRVIPIEVKSGKYYKTHAALDNLLSSEEYSVGEAFVIQTDNVVCDGRTTYIPVYMTMMLKKEDAAGDMTVTPNLEGLR